MVPWAGLEPARREAPDSESGMSTNFITKAFLRLVHQERLELSILSALAS